MDTEMAVIELEDIKASVVALRVVNRETEAYQGLVGSIKEKGVIMPITVRPKTDEEDGSEYYELIDGLHRFTAAKDAGLTAIPASIRTDDDAAVLEVQLMANIHRVVTSPSQYTEQLKRMMMLNPKMAVTELAKKLGKSPQWINDRMSLTKIEDEGIKALIDDGTINIGNAYALAKLPVDEQINYIDSAANEDSASFVAKCSERVKEIRDAKRKGKDSAPVEFKPREYQQKLSVIKDELSANAVGPSLCATTGATSAEDGWKLAIQWILHMDAESLKSAEAEFEQKQAERAAKAEKRKAEQDAKKAKKAAEKKAKEDAAAEAGETAEA